MLTYAAIYSRNLPPVRCARLQGPRRLQLSASIRSVAFQVLPTREATTRGVMTPVTVELIAGWLGGGMWGGVVAVATVTVEVISGGPFWLLTLEVEEKKRGKTKGKRGAKYEDTFIVV